MFELRIDRLVDKWSGSIEVGMTTHDPSTIDALPDTMTNQRSGTMMMSGCGILTNGKGTRRYYINEFLNISILIIIFLGFYFMMFLNDQVIKHFAESMVHSIWTNYVRVIGLEWLERAKQGVFIFSLMA